MQAPDGGAVTTLRDSGQLTVALSHPRGRRVGTAQLGTFRKCPLLPRSPCDVWL